MAASPEMAVREAMAPRVLLALKDRGKCWVETTMVGKAPAWET